MHAIFFGQDLCRERTVGGLYPAVVVAARGSLVDPSQGKYVFSGTGGSPSRWRLQAVGAAPLELNGSARDGCMPSACDLDAGHGVVG